MSPTLDAAGTRWPHTIGHLTRVSSFTCGICVSSTAEGRSRDRAPGERCGGDDAAAADAARPFSDRDSSTGSMRASPADFDEVWAAAKLARVSRDGSEPGQVKALTAGISTTRNITVITEPART